MTTPVSDSRSNKHEQVAHAAEVLANAPNRIKVFEAIYRGKRAVKTRAEIEGATGLNNKQVLNAAKALVDNQLVSQERKDGQTAYRKDTFFASHKQTILRLVADPAKLAAQPRSAHPRSSAAPIVVEVAIPRSIKPPKQVTVDDIDSFHRVRSIRDPQPKRVEIPEEQVKHGVQRIVGEAGDFKDWGGETNDLYTSRVRLHGRRKQASFAFKGRAQTGKLTPGKMGKNGDQLQRLMATEADLFVVQYVGEISETVVAQVAALALARAAGTGREVHYCVIDGQDTARLMKAYPEAFSDV
jgi:hypothetical protein